MMSNEFSVGLIPAVLALLLSVPVPAQQPCLDGLPHDRRNIRFDREHDRDAPNGSFSCDVRVPASVAAGVLEEFRYGFLNDSRPHLQRSIRFPLEVTVADTERVITLESVEEWLRFKARHFDQHERAMIACANLRNVMIVPKWSGFAIGPGRVWFLHVAGEGLRVARIHTAAMDEKLFLSSCVSGGPAQSAPNP